MKRVEVPAKGPRLRWPGMEPANRVGEWPLLSDLILHSNNQMKKAFDLAPTGLMKYSPEIFTKS